MARPKGISACVGDGDNLWPSACRIDVARVFHLALEHGAEGGPFHAIAKEGIPFRTIAKTIGRRLGVPTMSISFDEATQHFGVAAMFIAGSGPAANARTNERLQWQPRELDLIVDIDRHYFS